LLALMFGGSLATLARPPGRAPPRPGIARLSSPAFPRPRQRGNAAPDLSMKVHSVRSSACGRLRQWPKRARRPHHRPAAAHAGIKLLWGEDASRWSIAQVREKDVASIPDEPLALACVAD